MLLLLSIIIIIIVIIIIIIVVIYVFFFIFFSNLLTTNKTYKIPCKECESMSRQKSFYFSWVSPSVTPHLHLVPFLKNSKTILWTFINVFFLKAKTPYHPADSRNEGTANTLSLSWSHSEEWPTPQPAPAPTACPAEDHTQSHTVGYTFTYKPSHMQFKCKNSI